MALMDFQNEQMKQGKYIKIMTVVLIFWIILTESIKLITLIL